MEPVKKSCPYCPNKCLLRFFIDNEGLVSGIKRVARNPRQSEVVACGNNVALLGKTLTDVEVAFDKVHIPGYIGGGH